MSQLIHTQSQNLYEWRYLGIGRFSVDDIVVVTLYAILKIGGVMHIDILLYPPSRDPGKVDCLITAVAREKELIKPAR